MTTTNGRQPPYVSERFYFVALDPVHVGAGGYRLGRVDMSIVREPGTNLPKVPGTSLAGATRSYAAMRYGKPQAAGQHRKLRASERQDCPILYTFGTATGTEGGWAGAVSMGDARILLFPVASQSGPIWISTPEILREAWGPNAIVYPKTNNQEVEPSDNPPGLVTSLVPATNSGQARQAPAQQSLRRQPSLALGWLLLPTTHGLQVTPPGDLAASQEWKDIAGRIALVTPKLFAQITNSNLEIRTSVSIDPATGAAETGALFTYEAIPRATWLWCDVVVDDYKRAFKAVDRQYKPAPEVTNGAAAEDHLEDASDAGNAAISQQQPAAAGAAVSGIERAGELLGQTWNGPLDVVKAGVRVMEYLGVGGMGTRGFGRLRWIEPSSGGSTPSTTKSV